MQPYAHFPHRTVFNDAFSLQKCIKNDKKNCFRASTIWQQTCAHLTDDRFVPLVNSNKEAEQI